jgi:HB1, ASXL, restriction endonuclease HTH domain
MGSNACASSLAQSVGDKKDGKKPKAAPKEKKPKALSLIDAAAQVLAGSKGPMNCKQMVDEVSARKLWAPRKGGKTPHATLYSAILRETQKKGKEARFTKVERGQFKLTKGA